MDQNKDMDNYKEQHKKKDIYNDKVYWTRTRMTRDRTRIKIWIMARNRTKI